MQIIVKLTTDCNLACSYCIEGNKPHQRLPETLFEKMIDDLPDLLREKKSDKIDILFHGGEPMLYGLDNIKRLVRYGRGRLTDFKVKFMMQTNGTLIDDEWINFFKEEKISVGISLDGYPSLHDSRRKNKSGEPTADLIISNIKKMQAANLHFGTLMVLDSTEDIDVDLLFEFILEHDLQPKIHPVIASGRAEGRTDTDEVNRNYLNLMKRLLQKALSNNLSGIIEPLDGLLNAILGVSSVSECSFNGSCAEQFICVYADGTVGFCGRDNGAGNLVYGRLIETSLPDLYNSDNARKIRNRQMYLLSHDCKNCADWELCRGGCSFEAVNAFGTLEAKYPGCEMRKELINYLRTEGINLLKDALIREKTRFRSDLQTKKQMARELETMDFINSTEVYD